MEKSIFNYSHYREYMHERLSAQGRRGQLSKAAVALSCQSSFLSRVINQELHLTPEHAFKLGQFWALSPDERNFFQKLVEYERAGDPEYKNFLKVQIEDLRKAHNEIGARTKRASKNFEGLSTQYFSSWVYSAIHFMTTVSDLQKISALSRRLNLPEEHIKKALQDLIEMGFVQQNKDRYVYRSGEFHLDRTSPLVTLHHQNWRYKALLNAQSFNEKDIHYTTVLTLSRKDILKLQALILDHLSEINQIAAPSNPEDVAVFNCDFFKI